MDAARVIYGVDFSGAQDAGNKIWIARGVIKGNRLLIEECSSARTLLKSEKDLLPCMVALVDLIKSSQDATFGFDFPFGLPALLIKEKTWEDFVSAFSQRFGSPEAFRNTCSKSNEGHELRRQTDSKERTPFSPYNLRLFKQTYYGISKVLFPLVQAGSACVLPFQAPVTGKPWILEVCPTSTLKSLMKGSVPSYKGPGENKRENRRQILGVLKKTGVAFVKNAALEDKIIANPGGDALDSENGERGDRQIILDLNPVRTELVRRPEDYRWGSLGYHVQTRNKGRFLSLDFGLREFGVKSRKERLRNFRRFVYEKGRLEGIEKEKGRDFEMGEGGSFPAQDAVLYSS